MSRRDKAWTLLALMLVVVLVVALFLAPALYFLLSTGNNEDETVWPVEVTLGVGEEVQVADLHMRFVRVVEDSRCPPDAYCVWAGQVVVQVELNDYVLNLTPSQTVGTKVDNYAVFLTEVSPLWNADKAPATAHFTVYKLQ